MRQYKLIFLVLVILAAGRLSSAGPLTASWYDRASCIKESGQAKMANGKELDDEVLSAASWDYPFGTVLQVTNLQNNKKVMVIVTDRGPSRRLYRQGRVIDLSKGAFKKISRLENGVIPVKIEK